MIKKWCKRWPIINSARLRVLAMAKGYLLKDITARPSFAICTHTLVQLTSILHLRWNIYVQNIKHACNNKPTLYCSNNFFSLQSGFHVNLLFHNMMCVPANKQHAKIHGSHSEDKMEKSVSIWYVVFWLCYISKLQIFEVFFYLSLIFHH